MLTPISLFGPVRIIHARAADSKLATFEILAYDGNAMRLKDWELPVVLDLARLTYHSILVANLDHIPSARVGIIDRWENNGKQLKLFGTMNAASAARQEVLDSHKSGYQWEASIEASVLDFSKVEKGKTVFVNGRNHAGPAYVTHSMLVGCSFVSHGACKGTSVSIAAKRFPPDYSLPVVSASFGGSLANTIANFIPQD